MNTPEAPDRQLATLLRESTEGLEPDVAELVAGGVALGRTARRRRRAGTALAALGMGAVVAAAALAPGLGGSDSPEKGSVATQSGEDTKPETEPEGQQPDDVPFDAALAVDAVDVPATFEELLGAGDAGPVLSEPPYPVVNEPAERIAHFLYEGTLTTFSIEPASSIATCQQQANADGGLTCENVGGLETLTLPPTTNDQVTAQSVSVWRHGYVVTAVSYNAAEGKDVAPLTEVPPIGLDQLGEIARSDAWFSWKLVK